jgi:hypothetical protein
MFGHGCLVLDPDLDCVPVPDWLGVVLDGVGEVVVVGVVLVLAAALVLVVPVVVGAAAAPAMPATAPPEASAPATIVAPSSFDTFIGQTSWWWIEDCMCEPSSTRPLSAPIGTGKTMHRGV